MTGILKSMKFSANIPDDLLEFLDTQVTHGHFKSRSQALTEALHSWRTERLADDYRIAFVEEDITWDIAVADGLHDAETP